MSNQLLTLKRGLRGIFSKVVLAGFFMAAKRNAPKRGVGPAMLSLGGLYFLKYLH